MAKIRNKIQINTAYGLVTFVTFHGLEDRQEHFAIIFQNGDQVETPNVRVHSECITGDLFGSFKCDCGDQLQEVLKFFSKTNGVLIYLRQEGRGIGLYNKLDAYLLQQKGFDTYEANCLLNFPEDMRRFDVAAEMLKALEIKQIKLFSNNPNKYSQLQENGIEVKKLIPTGFYLKPENKKYLQTKVEKAGHLFLKDLLSEITPC